MIRVVLAAAAIFAAAPAPAAEITVRKVPVHDEAVVILKGKINLGDHVDFKQQTDALKGKVFLFLDSRGGEIATAIDIGNFIHMNQWTTVVTNGDVCNSACALIWFSGTQRDLGMMAQIGMHSSGTRDDPPKRNEWGNLVVTKYLAAIGVPQEIVNRFTVTDPSGMDYIGYDEARALGLLYQQPKLSTKGDRLTSPWFFMPIPSAGPTPPATKIR